MERKRWSWPRAKHGTDGAARALLREETRRPAEQVVVFFNCSAWGEGQGPEGRFFQTRAAEEQSCESAETYGGKRRD